MKKILFTMLMCLCSLATAAEGTGYRIVHPDGTVEFTDDATLGGEEIKLRGIQTVGGNEANDEEGEAEDKPRKKKVETPVKPTPSPAYTGVALVSPLEGESIWFNEKGLEVRFKVLPELNKDDTVVVELDGLPRARGKSLVLNAGMVYRGTHTVSAKVVDSQGKTLISSPVVTFHLRQHNN